MENELGKKIIELDARPSDSIVLALQMKKPIFASQKVLDNVEDMSEILERILKKARLNLIILILNDKDFEPPLNQSEEKPSCELSVPCQTALAPMQDVTGLPFMSVIARRVHLISSLPNSSGS